MSIEKDVKRVLEILETPLKKDDLLRDLFEGVDCTRLEQDGWEPDSKTLVSTSALMRLYWKIKVG